MSNALRHRLDIGSCAAVQGMETPIHVLISLFFISGSQCDFMKLCYLPSRTKDGSDPKVSMAIEEVDPFVCTHLVWAFGGIDIDRYDLKAAKDEDESKPDIKGRLESFTDLKKENPKLKTILAIGGEPAENKKMEAMSKSVDDRNLFARNVALFLKSRKFDGLSVDWQYPSKEERTANGFVALLKTLYETFADDGGFLTLSTTIDVGHSTIPDAYDICAVHPHVHFLSLMNYDHRLSGSEGAAFNSLHYKREVFDETMYANWTANRDVSEGRVPPSKIVVGFTWVGRRLALSDKQEYTPASSGTRDTMLEDLYNIPDALVYPEICSMKKETDVKRSWDKEQPVRCPVHREIIPKEMECATRKTLTDMLQRAMTSHYSGKLKWLVNKGLSWMILWALDLSDYTGKTCKEEKDPLPRYIDEAVKKYIQVDDSENDDDDTDDGDDDSDGSTLRVSLTLMLICCTMSLLRL